MSLLKFLKHFIYAFALLDNFHFQNGHVRNEDVRL